MGEWKSKGYAPLKRDLEVWVTDGVEEYCLGVLCHRTDEGWINSKLRVPLSHRLKVIAWREPK